MKNKNKKSISNGIIHVQTTHNNTIITISNLKGDNFSWASAGSLGFKGTRKGTAFASQIVAEKTISDAIGMGLKKVKIFLKGQSSGRESVIRVFLTADFKIIGIKDVSPIAHNGCRPPQPRRV